MNKPSDLKQVDMTKIPRGPYHIRPDFMSPSAGMVLNGKDLELEEAEMDDLENPDSINILDPDTQRFTRPIDHCLIDIQC